MSDLPGLQNLPSGLERAPAAHGTTLNKGRDAQDATPGRTGSLAYRPYVPKPGDPYPSFAELRWNGESVLSVRTVTMLIRQPRKEGDPDAR